MNEYYGGNGIYDFINSAKKFHFVCENKWIVIYGNSECEPKVIIALSLVSKDEYDNDTITTDEHNLYAFGHIIREKSRLPLVVVRFYEQNQMNVVKIYKSKILTEINMAEYRHILEKFGLELKERTQKKINDKASNCYQMWQLNYGCGLKASDIDLLYDNDNRLLVFELKRSYIDYDKWEPYPEDYNNFKVIYNVCKLMDAEFYIIYNYRRKNPFFEDLSRLKVFKVDFNNKTPIELVNDEISLIDFINIKNM